MTISEEVPSAPPRPDDDFGYTVPMAKATPVVATAVPGSISPPAANASMMASTVPPGMIAKTVTTSYPDGRQVTTTEYVPAAGASSGAAASTAIGGRPAATQATNAVSQHHPPRRDLGARPMNVTCPYCNATGKTRVNQNCGDCTIISVIVLLLFCFPFFWVPFICPSCMDSEHHCSNCGRIVGKSRAECCN
mmetsp:Transcript_31011/g.56792  ORF Transcript_31011/g.56792 Transcript_31011/m.56792 type:complete len:192 (+) Transcript_31011:211-786(+)